MTWTGSGSTSHQTFLVSKQCLTVKVKTTSISCTVLEEVNLIFGLSLLKNFEHSFKRIL